MNKQYNKKISALVSLLEDEDNDIAASAMSELLSYGKKIGPVIGELQESSNLLIRRRIHQMQAIIKTRNNRDKLSRRFRNKHSGLWQGLNELHLLWYDNDNTETLRGLRKELLEKAAIIKPSTTAKLSELMKAMAFICSGKGEIEPDFYCIGSVLETKVGADFILCSIAQTIASYYGWKGKIVYSRKNGYMLLDSFGYKISPKKWNIIPKPIHFSKLHVESPCLGDLSRHSNATAEASRRREAQNLLLKARNKNRPAYNKAAGKEEFEEWSSGMLLKHAVFHLYLCAISSDSIRYVYTIGLCLAKMLGKGDIHELLPYPFNGTARKFHKKT